MTIFRSDEEALSLLGLKVGSSRAEVESAFRKRSLRCHPDRHPKDALAKTRFHRLSRAKEHLLAKAGKLDTSSTRTFSSTSGAGAADTARRPQQHQRRTSDGERKRREARERLRQREAAAEMKRRRQREAEAKASSHQAAARVQEKRREELAAQQRRREELFEAWRQKKHCAASAPSDAKTSSAAAPQQHPHSQAHNPDTKPHKRSNESPWDSSEGNASQRSCSKPSSRRSSPDGSCKISRHQEALLRLQKQRDCGDMPSIFRPPQGSWWKADKEVDLYLRREQLCGL